MSAGGVVGHDPGDESAPLAVKVATLTGQLALLAQSNSINTQNLNSTVMGMQSQLTNLERTTQAIALEQRDARSHSEGLERVAGQIEKFTRDSKADWEKHLIENKATADQVTGFNGAIKVIAWVFGILAALSTAIISIQFSGVRERIDAIIIHRERMEARIERLEGRGP